MARGGFRPGAGRPPKPKPKAELPRVLKSSESRNQKQLEYMLAVMNDPDADPVRRDRMAIAAAPYVHARITDPSKKKSNKKEPGK
jgi:phage terminase small subunit